MIAFAYYLLKVILCSGLLFFYYHLGLRNKLFHQWNRFYLLACIIVSLIVPCLEFNIGLGNKKELASIRLLDVVYSADDYVAEINTKHAIVSNEQWATLAYSFVSIVVFVLFILALIRIGSIVRSHSVVLIEDIKFVNTSEKDAPFSFLNFVFWNNQIDLNSSSGEHIFKHELVHVREKHSWDKIFLQLVLTVCWCNPFFWLIRRELKMIHEFIADQKSVGQSDASAFAAMILRSTYPAHYNFLTNQFFQSSIKRRLLMLTKNHDPKFSYFSRVLALPLFAFVLLAFTLKEKNNGQVKDLAADKETAAEIHTNKSLILKDTTKPLRITLNTETLEDTVGGNFLVIVDGVEKGRAKDLKVEKLVPADQIERMDVYKGNAAIQKFGVKGKEGVIIITTKNSQNLKTITNKIQNQNNQATTNESVQAVAPKTKVHNADNALLIVNGVEMGTVKDIGKHINVNHIKDINVLKGSSALQIYGDKAKHGVILVTTNEPNIYNKIQTVNMVFEQVEKPAEFPGGIEAWRRYLERNLDASIPAKNGAAPGTYTVTTQFIVHEDGSLSDIKALTSHGYDMEGEVIRILKRGPRWVPAEQNGHKVTSYRRQPVTFVIPAQ